MILKLSKSFNKLNIAIHKSPYKYRTTMWHNLLSLSNNASQTETTANVQQQNNEELKTLQEKIKKIENDLDDYKDKLLRALADAENTRNRMLKQVNDAKIFGIQNFSKDLLEVADILNLAVKNTDPGINEKNENDLNKLKEQLSSMYKGLAMTQNCLLKIFEKHGLIQINPKEGDKFDPNLHEAIFRIPIQGKTSGSVNVVTKVGYRLNDRVLRAAHVGVVQ